MNPYCLFYTNFQNLHFVKTVIAFNSYFPFPSFQALGKSTIPGLFVVTKFLVLANKYLWQKCMYVSSSLDDFLPREEFPFLATANRNVWYGDCSISSGQCMIMINSYCKDTIEK